jgi:hypothetical protein
MFTTTQILRLIRALDNKIHNPYNDCPDIEDLELLKHMIELIKDKDKAVVISLSSYTYQLISDMENLISNNIN